MMEMVYEYKIDTLEERELKEKFSKLVNGELKLLKELEYSEKKKREYFEKLELKKIESINSIFFAGLTIVTLISVFI